MKLVAIKKEKLYLVYSYFWICSLFILSSYNPLGEGSKYLTLLLYVVGIIVYCSCISKNLILLFIAVFILTLFPVFIGGFISIEGWGLIYVSFISLFLFSKYLSINKNNSYKLSVFFVISYYLFVAVSYLDAYYMDVPFSRYADTIFDGRSRNIVSFYMLVASIFYLLNCRISKIQPNFILILLCFIFSVLLYGRSGILVSLGLVIIYLSFFVKKILLLLLFVLISLIIFSGGLTQAVAEIVSTTKFSHGFESLRLTMLGEYFETMSLENFLLGRDVVGMPTVALFEGNSHNSFIQFNLNFGYNLVLLILLIILLSAFFICSDMFILLLFFMYILRLSLDVVLFSGGFTDFLFYLFVFYSIQMFSTRFNTSSITS